VPVSANDASRMAKLKRELEREEEIRRALRLAPKNETLH
jgi:hypothetical protein